MSHFCYLRSFWGSELNFPNKERAAKGTLTFGVAMVAGRMLSPSNAGIPNAAVQDWLKIKIADKSITASRDPWINGKATTNYNSNSVFRDVVLFRVF